MTQLTRIASDTGISADKVLLAWASGPVAGCGAIQMDQRRRCCLTAPVLRLPEFRSGARPVQGVRMLTALCIGAGTATIGIRGRDLLVVWIQHLVGTLFFWRR